MSIYGDLGDRMRQSAALLGIAKLRRRGLSDAAIFAMDPESIIALGAQTGDAGVTPVSQFDLAGNSAEADRALRQAMINASLKTSRAGEAITRSNDLFQHQMDLAKQGGDPFNVVSYLDALGRLGARIPLLNPVLQNIRPLNPDIPADPVGAQVDKYLTGDAAALAGGGRLMLKGPAVVEDARTGADLATLAENGKELLEQTSDGVRAVPQRGVSRHLDRGRQARIIDMARQHDGSYARLPHYASGGTLAPHDNPEATPRGYLAPHDNPAAPPFPYGNQLFDLPARNPAWQDAFRAAFGARRGDPGYNASFDYDNDGVISILDAARHARMTSRQMVGGGGGGGVDPWQTPTGRLAPQPTGDLAPRDNPAAPSLPFQPGLPSGATYSTPRGGPTVAPGGLPAPHDNPAARGSSYAALDLSGYDPTMDRVTNKRRRVMGAAKGAFFGFDTADQAKAAAAAAQSNPLAWGNIVKNAGGGSEPDYRYGPSTGTNYGRNPVGRVSYIRDAEGNLTATANADPTAFQYGDAAGQVQHAPGSIIHEVINGRTVSRPLSDAEAAAIAAEMRAKDIAYRKSQEVGDQNGVAAWPTLWENMSDYGDNMKNWPLNTPLAYDEAGNRIPTHEISPGVYGTPMSDWASGKDRNAPHYGEWQPSTQGSKQGADVGIGTALTRGKTGGSSVPFGMDKYNPPAAGGGGTTPGDQQGNTSQAAAAKLLAPSMKAIEGLNPKVVSMLEAGEVPPIGLIDPTTWRRMKANPTVVRAYLGLLQSTGWVGTSADVDAAMEAQRPAGPG